MTLCSIFKMSFETFNYLRFSGCMCLCMCACVCMCVHDLVCVRVCLGVCYFL